MNCTEKVVEKLYAIHGKDAVICIHHLVNALVTEYRVIDAQGRKFLYMLPDNLFLSRPEDVQKVIDNELLTFQLSE